MSHAITQRADGTFEFAYRASHGATWHGLGQALPDDASNNDWLEKSGMLWTVKRSKVRYATAHGMDAADMLEMPEQHVLFRSDTKAPLGIVGDGYKVVNPRDVQDVFLGAFKAAGLEMSAAGTLFGGRRFWATARIGEASPLSVGDKIGGYLLLDTSCDGSRATSALSTAIRAVCANTVAMAHAEGQKLFKVSHRSVFDIEEARRQMGIQITAWDKFKRDMYRWGNKATTLAEAEHMTATLLGAGDEAKGREQRAFNVILDLFNNSGKGAKLDGVFGTQWGWLNSITEYVDHHARATSEQNRFASAQWGPGASLKAKAVALIS